MYTFRSTTLDLLGIVTIWKLHNLCE